LAEPCGVAQAVFIHARGFVEGQVVVYAVVTDADRKSKIHRFTGWIVLSSGFVGASYAFAFFLV
jgi:hypothetical protein